MITFKDVSKTFGDTIALQNVSFTVEPGEFVCLTGPSGAGKSTIVQLLIRALMPTSGSIDVDGADIGALPLPLLQMYRRRTGVLFQDYRLLHDRTAAENITLSLEMTDATDELIEERLIQLLDMMKLTDRADALPHELSGGELTRTALARALITDPSILIADEPTGNLDPKQSMDIVEILRSVNAQGTTVILATHDRAVVDALGVRVIRLEKGRIVRDSVGTYDGTETQTRVPPPPKESPVPVSVATAALPSQSMPSTVNTMPRPPVSPPPLRGMPPDARYVPKQPVQKKSSPSVSSDSSPAPSSGRISPILSDE